MQNSAPKFEASVLNDSKGKLIRFSFLNPSQEPIETHLIENAAFEQNSDSNILIIWTVKEKICITEKENEQELQIIRSPVEAKYEENMLEQK